ncbi:MAG: ImmA/IrrE family metallo-endopeptidase [Acidimicrobiia bacterium]|nr:ImmA/IrrE family metallo-endopeptidase [Acidimicrobiia bacterium]MYB73794.1 ImmA/IrrE family metallo-endopeptidase [Acidimicrobiia bacterium]MYH99818.1 ImmA/IrrE family metallo-endopeptidase [Acidimicrobiia bacterium]
MDLAAERLAAGQQLQRLREAAGVPIQHLAAKSGISAEDLLALEGGKDDISGDQLADIAASLNISPLAVLEPQSLLGQMALATRMNSEEELSATTASRVIGLAELHWALKEGGQPAFPSVDWSPQIPISNWLARSNEIAEWAIERYSIFERENKNHNRFASLVAFIEDEFQIDVMVDSLGSEGPEGVSIVNDEFPFILINQDRSRPRALFTLAHELGHILNGETITLRIDRDLKARTDDERIANAFAAAFLMPENDIIRIIEESGRKGIALARMMVDFGVSFESLVYRLHNLQIINANGRDELRRVGWGGLLDSVEDEETTRILLAARGSRPERRMPIWLVWRCLHGVFDGIISAAPLADLLGVDIEELIDAVNAMRSDSKDTINAYYGSPRDSQEITISSFDADPISL